MSMAAVKCNVSIPSTPTTAMIEIEMEKSYPKIIKYNPELEMIEDDAINVIIEITPKILLPKALYNLMQRIFDPNVLTSALKGMQLGLKKLSVEELSQDQISAARRILKELAQELRTGLSPEHVEKASKEFYALIPHANSGKKFPLLDNPNIIDSKASMLNTLADIEIANRSIGDMILQRNLTRQDVIERYYQKLNCEISVLSHKSEYFKLIEEYARTNHRKTENFELDIIDIFEVNRFEEGERFNKNIGNIRLLWHGSRTVNFVGILSQGLHIPEKPRDLWFGKGVYFADTVCLSASYCDEEDSMLLLCEVALGDIDRKSNLDYELIHPDEKKDSVKGLGMWYPDRNGYCTIDDNVTVPIGQLIKREDKDDLILDYNEYIVYNINQIRIRYLVQVNIGMKGITRQNGLIANPAAV